MAYILEGQEGVTNMIDDILVLGRDRTEHDIRLTEVLDCLRKAGLTLNHQSASLLSPVWTFLAC